MKGLVVTAMAAAIGAGIVSAAPGSARADFNDTSTGDFCYGGWSTEILIDEEQHMVFVYDTCGDIGDTVVSYYRFARR